MSEEACRAIEEAWTLTVKTRALTPIMYDSAIGRTEYYSPEWYQKRGATYFVKPAHPLTATDIGERRQIGNFVNRSFIISMVAILQEYDVVPYRAMPTLCRDGYKHVKLTIWLRNRFGHGEWQYDASKKMHRETRDLLEELFPMAASGHSGFVTSIDGILEPLKNGVLAYIRAGSQH